MDDALIDDVILIPNGINQWNRERYEITGYINNVNTQYTQALMEYGPSGYGNIYEYGVQRNSLTNNGKTSYYAYDGRGSVSEVLSSSGNPQLRYSYGAFGETTTTYLSYVDNPYRYNGEYVDAVPGIPDMQYLRARYYAPHEGRFFTQDTVQDDLRIPLSQNLYLYCRNNGVMFIDPSGHISLSDIPLGIRISGQAAIDSYIRGMEKKNNTSAKAETAKAANSTTKQSSGGSSVPLSIQMAGQDAVDSYNRGMQSQSSSGSSSGNGSSNSSNNPRIDNPKLAQQVASSAPQVSEWEIEMRRKYNEGQMMLSEKMWFEQNVLPKFPKFVGYLAYGAQGITQNKDEGYFALYDKPTLPVTNADEIRVYNTGELYDQHKDVQDMPRSALQGFGDSAAAMPNISGNTKYGNQELDPTKGTLLYDGTERYSIALGPRLQNPNFDLSATELLPDDMAYGTCVDISIDLNGERYYIPAIIVDVKAHTFPTGVFQTGYPFDKSGYVNTGSSGNIVEWYTYRYADGIDEAKNKSANLNKFNRSSNIVVYENEILY